VVVIPYAVNHITREGEKIPEGGFIANQMKDSPPEVSGRSHPL
jgi:hypothetical protein